jgi:hypothetical protein
LARFSCLEVVLRRVYPHASKTLASQRIAENIVAFVASTLVAVGLAIAVHHTGLETVGAGRAAGLPDVVVDCRLRVIDRRYIGRSWYKHLRSCDHLVRSITAFRRPDSDQLPLDRRGGSDIAIRRPAFMSSGNRLRHVADQAT